MIRLLTLLLELLNRFFQAKEETKIVQQEREAAAKEVTAHVEKAEAAVATPDPDRDQRLRNKYGTPTDSK